MKYSTPCIMNSTIYLQTLRESCRPRVMISTDYRPTDLQTFRELQTTIDDLDRLFEKLTQIESEKERETIVLPVAFRYLNVTIIYGYKF